MSKLLAGTAEVVITPAVGVPLSGYMDRTSPSVNVMDDLYAKAVVLDDGRTKLAFVVCDVIGLDASIAGCVRVAVSGRTGIPTDHIMVTATHTHCGPDLYRMPQSSVEHLEQQIAGAVWSAYCSMREVRIGWGSGECYVGVNRRNPRSPYGPYFLYSYPEGAMDPQVVVLSLINSDDSYAAVALNYACHAVTLGGSLSISKDFVHYTCKTLKSASQNDPAVLFIQGCAGNINPRWKFDHPELDPIPDRRASQEPSVRAAEMRRLGNILGAESLKAAESIITYDDEVTLAAQRKEITLTIRPDYKTEYDFGEESKIAEREARAGSRLTEVQVFRIGDAYIVGLPGEIFVEYQLSLRRRFPLVPIIVSELANDCVDYIPTPKAFDEGGYEPKVARFVPEAGEQLEAAAVELIEALA